MSTHPPWLRSSDNGTIGEARTQAFLIDRFWILQRCVDIHGTDFIIQRKLYEHNLLDRSPPRFGVIQSKFSQTENTRHTIKKSYALDKDGTPYGEFFVVVHTGTEDQEEQFLLSAGDLQQDFDHDSDSFIVPMRQLTSSDRYKVNRRGDALDRLEKAIQEAEFDQNRLFIYNWLKSNKPDLGVVAGIYRRGLDSFYDDVPARFRDQKQEAFETMLKIAKVYDKLDDFVRSSDPMEAYQIAHELQRDMGDSVLLPGISGDDLYYDARSLREMTENLQRDGCLSNFLATRESIKGKVESSLHEYQPNDLGETAVHQIVVKYDAVTLHLVSVADSMLAESAAIRTGAFCAFDLAREGKVVLSWRVGLQARNAPSVRLNGVVLLKIMEKIYGLKYLEGEEVL